MNILTYDFMIRALIAAVLVGLAAPAIGIYLVQRRLALLGDGIGHIALMGVAVGFLTQTNPVLTAVLVATAGGVLVEAIRLWGKTSADVALAVLFYGGIAGGVLLLGIADVSSTNLVSYLFGSLLTTSTSDLWVMAIVVSCVLVACLVGRPWLFAVSHDEEYAKVSGLPVQFLTFVLAVLASVTITVAMRVVGLLLVSALMVIPVATAQRIARGFTGTLFLAMGVGLGVSVCGVLGSYYLDTAPGATIVTMAIVVFALVLSGAGLWNAVRRRVT